MQFILISIAITYIICEDCFYDEYKDQPSSLCISNLIPYIIIGCDEQISGCLRCAFDLISNNLICLECMAAHTPTVSSNIITQCTPDCSIMSESMGNIPPKSITSDCQCK